MPIAFTARAGGLQFSLKVVPGASRDRIIGALGDALKVAVAAPPEGGAANKAVTVLLAAGLGVPTANVQIVRGHSKPRKEVVVAGIAADALAAKLAEWSAGK